MKMMNLVIGVVLIAIAITALSSVYTVREDQQVLVVQFGEVVAVEPDPGLHLKVPIIQNILEFDKRVLDFDAPAAEIPTLDQKQLVVDSYARYRIIDPEEFYRRVNNEINAQGQLDNIISARLRAVFGDVPLATLLTEKRADLMRQITADVDRAAQNLGIQVVDVRIKRIDLPEENSQAIFRRMQTQREQEARRIRAEGDRDSRRIRADADKQQRVIIAEARKTAEITRGEGDAEATRLYNEAYGRDRQFFDFFRSLQAMSRGLDGQSTSYVGPPAGDFYRYFGNAEGAATVVD